MFPVKPRGRVGSGALRSRTARTSPRWLRLVTWFPRASRGRTGAGDRRLERDVCCAAREQLPCRKGTEQEQHNARGAGPHLSPVNRQLPGSTTCRVHRRSDGPAVLIPEVHSCLKPLLMSWRSLSRKVFVTSSPRPAVTAALRERHGSRRPAQ